MPTIEHRMILTPTDLHGVDSGRRRWRVVCETCKTLVHEATTGPEARVREHIIGDGHSAYEQPLMEAPDTVLKWDFRQTSIDLAPSVQVDLFTRVERAERRVRELEAEVKFYSDAILRAEWAGGSPVDDHCPWCERTNDQTPHSEACPVTRANALPNNPFACRLQRGHEGSHECQPIAQVCDTPNRCTYVY
jgi:hypothetical protein